MPIEINVKGLLRRLQHEVAICTAVEVPGNDSSDTGSEARTPAEPKQDQQELFSEVPQFGMVSPVPLTGNERLPSSSQRVTVILRSASIRSGRGGWVLKRPMNTCPGLKGVTI